MSSPIYIDDYTRNPANVLTVGTFDGVHLGHQVLIGNVVKRARKLGVPAVVVTFDPHPRSIIHPGSGGIRLLTTLQERSAIMREYGVDQMVVIPFTRDFSMISSAEFIAQYLHRRIGMHTFVIGYDHQFGRNREGTIQTVETLGRELGFSVHVQQAHEVGHITVSSTVIRTLLEQKGDVSEAASMLGRPYEWSGTVVKGDQRGRTIGFPTANLRSERSDKVIPAPGVYCVEAMLPGTGRLSGMMNIGKRPTFNRGEALVPEVHLFDFNETIYGSTMRVRFIGRVRGEIRFSSSHKLIEQLQKDRLYCEQLRSSRTNT